MIESPSVPELPRGYGPPPARAALSADPEDFRVTEIEKFRPAGEGTYAWLRVRKRGVNTEEVAAAIARTAGTPRSAVGFAGMKDRLAVAIQWFSVDLAGRDEPRWAGLERERLSQDRRALRVMPGGLECRIEPQRRMRLTFSLPPGAYATTVLGEIVSLDRFRRSGDGPRLPDG